MNRPRLHDRVTVTRGPFAGESGAVCRMLRRGDPESWVALDRRTEGPHPFPVGDPRETHALIEWADMAALIGARPLVLPGEGGPFRPATPERTRERDVAKGRSRKRKHKGHDTEEEP